MMTMMMRHNIMKAFDGYNILRVITLSITLSSIILLGVDSSTAETTNLVDEKLVNTGSSPLACTEGLRKFDENLHKTKYKVGVHAIRGADAARAEYTKGYSEYLTMTAGRRFDVPIEFEMVPVAFEDMFDLIRTEHIDFFFANPSFYTCIGVEEGASPLATIVSRLEVRGHTFELDVFGGVIATRWDNDDISSIEDLKDKVIGAGSMAQVMAGQLQFHEMQKAGLSYVMDPKQVVLAYNQLDVVHGVLNGEFDVGFFRTDTIERTIDPATGKIVDPDLFKILEPKIYIVDDGNLFPFLHSTPIYPEWPFAALTHVPQDISEEVQEALLALGKHAETGQELMKCYEEFDRKTCDSLAFPKDFDPTARCDTTKEVAQVALQATLDGKFARFRTARSYFEPRSMLQDAGFMKQDERGNWYCTRAETLYDGIECPAGHFKRSRKEFEAGCGRVGLECKEGYDCFCKPCVAAFEVDVYPVVEGEIDYHLHEESFGDERLDGCDKMSLCGSVQQTKNQTFRIYDNRERKESFVEVRMHVGSITKDLEVKRVENTSWAYEFIVHEDYVGVEMLEIFINGKQIPESPIRVQVVERDCDMDYGIGSHRIPKQDGACVCENGTMKISEKCISSIFFFVFIAIGVFLITFDVAYLYLRYKKRQGDDVWLVSVDELHFAEPLEIVGQGAFGVVLLAEYRGTKVAVKRVLPPNLRSRSRSRSHGRSHDSRDNSKDSPCVDINDSASIETPPEAAHRSNSTLSASGMLRKGKRGRGTSPSPDGVNSVGSKTKGTHSQNNTNSATDSLIDMLGNGAYDSGGSKRKKSWFSLLCPCFAELEKHARIDDKILGGSHSGSSRGTSASTILWSVFPKCDKQSKQKDEFVSEMRLLSRLRHPCITTVMGAVISPIHEPMLVMEYMDYGSLYDLLRNETMFLGGEIILQVVRDVSQGMRYLHESKPPILHGDLKAKNILVDSRFRAKVCDFGLSEKKKHGIQGTPLWMAPEYLRGKSDYNTQCDIYSLGMIFYEIYARKSPYEGDETELREILRRICDPRVNKRPPIPETCPPKMGDIVKRCWSPDPFFRPSSKDLDLILMDMNNQDVDPIDRSGNQQGGGKGGKRASGDMLYDLFPKKVADALNAGQKVEAEQHELVTVVFSDIVGFTDISGTFSPLKVSQMLDRLYVCFDTIARKHNVFKVETIGDAYMGVTNLDQTQDECHVKNIAEFALDLVAGASNIMIDDDDPSRGFVQCRVGFHSGPVVSNVIGSLNPRYGLFGDTVNTASRMESNSRQGRILCTEKSALLLQQQAPEIPIRKRGKIGVKGKGNMVTYWVGKPKYLTKTSGVDSKTSGVESFSEQEAG